MAQTDLLTPCCFRPHHLYFLAVLTPITSNDSGHALPILSGLRTVYDLPRNIIGRGWLVPPRGFQMLHEIPQDILKLPLENLK